MFHLLIVIGGNITVKIKNDISNKIGHVDNKEVFLKPFQNTWQMLMKAMRKIMGCNVR